MPANFRQNGRKTTKGNKYYVFINKCVKGKYYIATRPTTVVYAIPGFSKQAESKII
jgi:hypothetical protein